MYRLIVCLSCFNFGFEKTEVSFIRTDSIYLHLLDKIKIKIQFIEGEKVDLQYLRWLL